MAYRSNLNPSTRPDAASTIGELKGIVADSVDRLTEWAEGITDTLTPQQASYHRQELNLQESAENTVRAVWRMIGGN